VPVAWANAAGENIRHAATAKNSEKILDLMVTPLWKLLIVNGLQAREIFISDLKNFLLS
jgi:hypothetical protein